MNDKILDGGCASKLRSQAVLPSFFYVSFWPPFDSKTAQGWASFEVLPRDPPGLYLSHVCPTTSLEATNTDVLISILLHCLFTLGLLCFSYSKWKGPPGCSPASQGLKLGQSRTGPDVGVRSSHAVTHPPLSNLGTYLDTPHTLFKDLTAPGEQSVSVTHSHLPPYFSESQQQIITQLLLTPTYNHCWTIHLDSFC